MRYLLLPLFLFVVAAASAQIDPGYRTTLVGRLDPVAPGTGIRYSALTGYAAPDGREYAILGGYDGTYIVEVTSAPFRLVSYIPGVQSIWREMKTFRNYAYVVTEGSGRQTGGLQIIDLSHLPDSATLARTDMSLFQKAHTITQEGNYIYVHGTDVTAGANGGTIIYDVATDPLHPRRVGAWTTRYVHDASVRNDTLYAAAINDGQLDIVYLGKDRKSPTLVAEIRYPNAGTHNAEATIDGSYVMTTDEIGGTPKTLKVWDIRDGNELAKVADYTPVPGETIHNVHIKGNLAFVSWYTAGTRILDISNPRDPVQLGFYDTYPGASSAMNGNWEVYPYLPSGKILASDMQTGLYVFTFDGGVRGTCIGVVRDEKTGAPLAGVRISSPRYGISTTSDVDGGFRVAGAADTMDMVAIKDGYYAKEVRMQITADGARMEILMRQLEFASVSINVRDSITNAPLDGFAWRMTADQREGIEQSGLMIFQVVKDSSIRLKVGSWGYQPKEVVVGSATASIDVALAPGYVDDAELDLGWQLGAEEDDATLGTWERGVPIGTEIDGRTIEPFEDATPGAGDHAFITGLSESPEAGSADVDDGATSLTSPRFDLTSYADPTIECSLWYVNDGNIWVDDTLQVLISNDDGATWQTLQRIARSLSGWTPFSFPVRSVVMPTTRMRFRVVASDRIPKSALFGSMVEAGLDEFRVVEGKNVGAGVAAETGGARGLAASVHPNPLGGTGAIDVMISRPAARLRVELFDQLGRRVGLLHDGPVSGSVTSLRLDAAGLATGRYSWRATLEDGTTASGSIAVVH